MLKFDDDVKIYLSQGPTDLRKSFYTLALLLHSEHSVNAQDGHIYCFCNRYKTRLKILQYRDNGYELLTKALDTERFHWPMHTEGLIEIDKSELEWLLHGLDLLSKDRHEEAVKVNPY